MFDSIKPDVDLPQDVLHSCAQELELLGDLFSAVRPDDFALSENGLTALCRKLGAVSRAVECIAWQITPGGRPAPIRKAA